MQIGHFFTFYLLVSNMVIVPVQLLLAFAFVQTCVLQLCHQAIATGAGTCARTLYIQVEYILDG